MGSIHSAHRDDSVNTLQNPSTMFDISDILKVFGAIYLTKTVFFWVCQAVKGIKCYYLPKFMKQDLKKSYGDWALVTGCTGGIGRAYTVALAEKGLNVVLVSRSGEKLENLAKDIETKFHISTKIIVIDFKRPESLPIIKAEIDKAKIEIGVLVNNVGYLAEHNKPFLAQSKEEILDMININCVSASILCHDFLPGMKERGKGAIINISSTASAVALPTWGVYCSTKHFLSTLTKILQLESQGSGVTIQDLIPGMVRTEMTKYLHDEVRSESMAPMAEVYVASALATLGQSSRTCGWWNHSLQLVLMWQSFPEWLSDRLFPSRFMAGYNKILEKKKDMEKKSN